MNDGTELVGSPTVFNGVFYATSVSGICSIRVNGVTVATAPVGSTSPAPVTYTASDADVVEVCTTVFTFPECGLPITTTVPAPVVIDTIRFVYPRLADFLDFGEMIVFCDARIDLSCA